MKRFLLSLLALAAVIAVGYVLFTAVLGLVQGLNPTVVGAFVTALIGLIGLWYVQWQSKSRDIAQSHRPSKIDLYNKFFDLVDHFQNNHEQMKEGEVSEHVKTEMAKLNRGLLIWGSPEVIRAWLTFRTTAQADGNVLVAVDAMYRAIRTDLGNSNFGLAPGDLIRIGLKDPNEWKS
jgi:hypothetical protein